MTVEEKSKLILLLQDMIGQRDEEAKKKDQENACLRSRLDELLHKLDESNTRIISMTQLMAQIQKDSFEKDISPISFLRSQTSRRALLKTGKNLSEENARKHTKNNFFLTLLEFLL